MTELEFSGQLISLNDNLVRFARTLTYNAEDANDLLQDTYLKALSSKDKFAEFTNLKAWAFTIMKNTFINSYRKSVRENSAFDNKESLLYYGSFSESQIMQPDSEFTCKEIINGIEALEDKFKIPFRMHTEGFKYEEIAKKLDLKIGTVKSRIFFARKKLKENLYD